MKAIEEKRKEWLKGIISNNLRDPARKDPTVDRKLQLVAIKQLRKMEC